MVKVSVSKESVIKTIYQYDLAALLEEWKDIQYGLGPDDWHNGNQTCLQYSSACADIFTEGCGSIARAGGRVESDFSILNPVYRGSMFETIIDDMQGVRSRIMVLPKRHCYSIHADRTSRLHLAMETNSDALFFWPENLIMEHIPADGDVYWTATTERHTFMNCGPEQRVHLVMCQQRTAQTPPTYNWK